MLIFTVEKYFAFSCRHLYFMGTRTFALIMRSGRPHILGKRLAYPDVQITGRLYKIQIFFTLQRMLEVSVTQEKLLEDRIHNLLPRYKSKKLSTSIYNLVLIHVCHFHHQHHHKTFLSNHGLSRYSCLHLRSLHPRIF